MISELRLGPLNSDNDKLIANREIENKVNQLIRDLNKKPDYYSKAEFDSMLASLSGDVDFSDYYTRSEVDGMLLEKANLEDIPTDYLTIATADNRYYTETEINNMRTVPFRAADGTFDSIPLTSNGAVPFRNADGSLDEVPLNP